MGTRASTQSGAETTGTVVDARGHVGELVTLRAWVLVVTLVAAVGLPAVGSARASATEAVAPAAAIVAVVDTGINPYHETFRDDSPIAYRHPSTYLPGFPENAVALDLTLNAPTYAAAVRADCERVWSQVKPGQTYWIPGTRIVGAISFGTWDYTWLDRRVDCRKMDYRAALVLDPMGHGTMTASRAVGARYGGCPTCRVVAVQMPEYANAQAQGESTESSIDAIEWAAANASWIDAQSNSWAPSPVPVWDPTGTATGSTPSLVRAAERVGRRHLAFWASGNGVANAGGVVGHPSLLQPHMGPSSLIVGGHDSGYVLPWSGFPPRFVGDACMSWAASHTSRTDESGTLGDGTSAATPFVAGTAVAMLAHARAVLGQTTTGVNDGVVARGQAGLVATGPLADGVFTLAEWRRLVEGTATRRPAAQVEDGPVCPATYAPWVTTPVRWADVPDQYPEYVNIGYGAVDRAALVLARQVLEGTAPAPDRTATDEFFKADGQVRTTTHGIFSSG